VHEKIIGEKTKVHLKIYGLESKKPRPRYNSSRHSL